MHCRSFSRKRNINTLVTVTVSNFKIRSKVRPAVKVIRLVGWEINIPFQHKTGYIGDKLRFSSARLRMANDTVISRPRCLFVQRRPKMGKDGRASFTLLH